MDQLQRFISDQNISRFVDRLQCEADAARQNTLKRLLVEEEDRFGAAVETLQMVERNIGNCATLIARQTEAICKLKNNGGDSRDAERALRTYFMIQDLFVSYRGRLKQAVNLE